MNRRPVLAAFVLATGLLAGPADAAAATGAPDGGHAFVDREFILRLRAAAIEPELDIPWPLVPGVGYSAVNLHKDTGGPYVWCESRGAGAYYTEIAEHRVIEQGPGEPGYEGWVFNPTEAEDAVLNPSGEETRRAHGPRVRNVYDGRVLAEIPARGNGVRWEATCDDDASGRATGANLDLAGAQAAGSTTVGHVDRRTGAYVGTSRAYVAGLATPGGTLDLISSVMTVKHLPGRQPTVSYRIGITGGTLAAGIDIPANELAAQFNDTVRANAATVALLGPFGLTLLGPTVSTSENGNRPIINAPFLELMLGLDARKGGIGENSRTRLVNIDYEGLYIR